jgi:glycosyltransferase involved in cell wall biosynthesis
MHRSYEISQRKTGIQVAIRMLPGRLDAFVQGLWAYQHLGPIIAKRYDFCIFGNPDNVLLPLLLKKRGLIETIIYDDWDFYPGFNRSWLWNHLTSYREHLCLSLADVVISVGSLLAELRKRQGAARTLVIPNGVNYPLFATAQAKRPHPPTLIYSGKLAEDFGTDVSIEGFAQVLDRIPEARYLIISYDQGPYVHYLHNLVGQLGLSNNVLFLGPKRYEELPHYLAEADIGVALFKPNDLMKYAFPLKIVEYMAAGLAVVGTEIGETEKLIHEGESGRCVPYSPEAFASAVLDILSDNAVLMGYSEHAKKYAKRYDWDTLFSGILDVIDAAVLTRGRRANHDS